MLNTWWAAEARTHRRSNKSLDDQLVRGGNRETCIDPQKIDPVRVNQRPETPCEGTDAEDSNLRIFKGENISGGDVVKVMVNEGYMIQANQR